MTMNETIMVTNFTEIGMRLKKIRRELGYTLDKMSDEANIARSYISQFERGLKYPNKTYLKYLFEVHNADLNYLLGGEGTPYRLSESMRKLYSDFGKFSDEVKEMLHYMITIPHTMYHILSCFSEYKVTYDNFIKEFKSLQNKEKEHINTIPLNTPGSGPSTGNSTDD